MYLGFLICATSSRSADEGVFYTPRHLASSDDVGFPMFDLFEVSPFCEFCEFCAR